MGDLTHDDTAWSIESVHAERVEARIDATEHEYEEHIIRSPEAEAYWRGVIAGDLAMAAEDYRKHGLDVIWSEFRRAAAFVRKPQEG